MHAKRINCILLLFFISFALLGMRLYYLQVWKHAFFAQRAQRQFVSLRNISSLRGRILDRRGRVLVFSTISDSCYADPVQIEHPAAVARTLAPYLDLPDTVIAQQLRSPHTRFVWLKRKMSIDDSQRIRALNIKGIGFIKEEKRLYPYGNLGGHVLGKVGIDNQPLSGVEFSEEDILSGTMSILKTSRDALGNEIRIATDAGENKPLDVVLTIDRTIQYITETELNKAMETYQAKQGIAIVQDPANGEILAMAIAPQLEMGSACMSVKELKNMAIGGVWEPGSTFKLVAMSAALEEGSIAIDDTFNCENGEYAVLDRVIHDHEKHGVMSVRSIFEQSSNIGMAKIGTRLGKKKFYHYARSFGFGARSGISIKGEAQGIFRPVKYWSGVSVSMLSFGQEIGVTPLQMIGAYSVIANGGNLMQPLIIKKYVDQNGTTVFEKKKTMIRKVLNRKTVEHMKQMLEGAVEHGTGTLARVEGFRVCGKTGTAQQIDKKTGRYSDERYLASFCGFLPAGKPRVCIYISLDSPQGVYWGGVVAGPVFSRIGSRIMAYLNVPPDVPENNPSQGHIQTYADLTRIN